MDWITAIKEIQRAQEDDRLVIFVGAGVSKNSDIPSWWELIKNFADKLGYSRCETCKKRIIDCPNENCEDKYEFTQDEFLRIPEYYYQQDTSENHRNYYELIQNTLKSDKGSNPIDDEIFSIFPRHIITTNYDSLLEKSQSVNSLLYTVVTQDSDLLAKASDHYIIKMHGDLEKTETIVLKESDYIAYEQEHPLICTFIKSLLVNHTFVFLGYSLNDNNLNLIIGWINYFKELHSIKERPANFWIDSKSATQFEQERLEKKNIYVVDLNSLPSNLETKATVPSSITNNTGRKLFAFLRCITNPEITYPYIPMKDRIVERYQLLKSYSRISYQDLIAVHPLGRTQFLDSTLIFYDRLWYECIRDLLSERNPTISEAFVHTGISAIQFYNEDMAIPVLIAHEPTDILFQLYIDNDYNALNEELENCKDLVPKIYYSNVLGLDKTKIEELLFDSEKLTPPTDYVSVLLHKMRARIATLSLDDRQENKTLELKRAFNISPPEKYRNAVSFMRMLFDLPTSNMQKMEKILNNHEKKYELSNTTIHFGVTHDSIWELKAYAYDYYFFFKKNGIPLDYFSEPKEYLSYYLKALLCSYMPQNRDSNFLGIRTYERERFHPIGEVDLDMFVKFTSPKTLKSWIEKYSIQKLQIEDGVDITQKFVNLCASFAQFKIKYMSDQIYCFTILLCLLDLKEKDIRAIYMALANIVMEASKSAPIMAEEVFDSIELILKHVSIAGEVKERTLLLDALLADNIYPILLDRKKGSFARIMKKYGKEISQNVKEKFKCHIEEISDITQKVRSLYFFRTIYSKKYCTAFFQEHIGYLSAEQSFNLLTEKIISFDEKCWAIFLNTLEEEDSKRKLQPGIRSYPDWLMVTIDESIILKLLGFDVKLASLEPYAHYSPHLSFMMKPEDFDYSQVNTENYMWQNLIYSKDYQPYFIAHKRDILSEGLRKIFDLGVATIDQQKVVYGILLDQDELQQF